MPLNPGVYCGLSDLLKGDLDLPRYAGDGTQYVNMGAEDIDARIGHIYVTPVEVDVDVTAERPTALILKRANALLASGRLMLDIAAASENAELHAYGASLVLEGLGLLKDIASGDMILAGAERIEDIVDPTGQNFTGPAIQNEDSESLVQSFYDRFNPHLSEPCPPATTFYGG